SSVVGAENLVMAETGSTYLIEKDDKYEIRDTRTGRVIDARKLSYSEAPRVDSEARNVVFGNDGRSLLFVTEQGEAKTLRRWTFGTPDIETVRTIGRTGDHEWIDEVGGSLYTIGNEGVVSYDIKTGKPRRRVATVVRTELVGAAVNRRGDQVASLTAEKLSST